MTEPARGSQPLKPITITNEIKRGAIARTLTTSLITVLVIVFLVAVAALVVGVSAIRAKQNSNAPLLKSIHDATSQSTKVNNYLLECTTPGANHQCYNDSQKRTGSALAKFEAIIVAANYCATLPSVHTLHQQYVCVQKQIPNLPATPTK